MEKTSWLCWQRLAKVKKVVDKDGKVLSFCSVWPNSFTITTLSTATTMTTGFRYRFLPWSPSAPAQIASTPGPFPGARCADWQQAEAGHTSAGSPGHTTPEWRPWCLLRSDLTSTLLWHNKGELWVQVKDLCTYKLTYNPVSGTSLKFWKKNSCQS